MKKQIIILIFLLFSSFTYGQTAKTYGSDSLNIDSTQILNRNECYLIIDKHYFKLDSITLGILQPEWIDKIEAVKENKYKNIFGNTPVKIIIYPKRKYKKRLLDYFSYQQKNGD